MLRTIPDGNDLHLFKTSGGTKFLNNLKSYTFFVILYLPLYRVYINTN